MFEGSSCFSEELKEHPELSVAYVTAKPRMALYMKYSTQIYNIYLRYIAPEDMHVYSIDEVFMDVTHYLNTYHMTAKELASKMILDVMQETGITATAGSEPTFICVKSQWISWQNMSCRMYME